MQGATYGALIQMELDLKYFRGTTEKSLAPYPESKGKKNGDWGQNKMSLSANSA